MTDVTLGIDVGGTNTGFGIVTEEGNIIFRESIPTNSKNSAEDLFERLFKNFDKLFSNHSLNYNLAGIGVGAPDANYYTDCVDNPPNLNWGFVNVKDLVTKHYELPFALTNDANAAAIGELQFGVAKEMKHFVVITLGTGLGSGIVVDGKVLYGHSGFAGELGHINAVKDGRECGCGKLGCLETYASATGIVRTVAELLGDKRDDSKLRDIPYSEMTAKRIYEAAKENDPFALEAFDFTGEILGQALGDTVNILSPEAIVLFGGLAQAGDLILQPTKKYMEEEVLNFYKGKVKLLHSGLDEGDAAVLGASALIWHELKSNKEC